MCEIEIEREREINLSHLIPLRAFLGDSSAAAAAGSYI